MDIVIECYKIVKIFPSNEKYGLTSQIQRAAVSIIGRILNGLRKSLEKLKGMGSGLIIDFTRRQA